MLSTTSNSVHAVEVIQHGTATSSGEHHTEVEVVEDSTGLLTIYVRQLHGDLDPVIVKMVGPQNDELQRRADTIALADRAEDANKVAAMREP